MIGWLGSAQLAAHQIALSMAATSFMVALGISEPFPGMAG
jgi:MATE family multidrug resistance protein